MASYIGESLAVSVPHSGTTVAMSLPIDVGHSKCWIDVSNSADQELDSFAVQYQAHADGS